MAMEALLNNNYLNCLAILIVYLLTHSEGSADIQEIRLVHTSPENSDIRYTVAINEPLNIIFEKLSINTLVTCSTYDYSTLFVKYSSLSLNPFTNETYLQLPTVSSDMSTKWICSINPQEESYSFEMHVKGARKPDVRILGRQVTDIVTERSVTEYDFISTYEFEDGETIDYTCKHDYKGGKLRLEYYDANGNMVLKTEELSKHINFRPSMRIKDIGSYADCIYITSGDIYFQEFTQRTQFKLINKTTMGNYIVSINDTRLRLIDENPIDAMDKYYYKFIPGELLKLSCEKKAIYYGDIYLKVLPKNGVEITVAIESRGTFIINPIFYDGAKVYCVSYAKTLATMKIEGRRKAASVELHRDMDREPVILGLHNKGLIYQYSKDENTWVTRYEYEQNEKLNLTCKSITNKMINWNLRGVPLQSRSDEYKTFMYEEFHLNSSYNNAEITCEALRRGEITRRHVVVLQQKLEALENQQDDKPRMFVIFGCASVILIAVITAICVLCWFKRIRNLIPKESPYENFDYSESPIPSYLQENKNISNMLKNSLYISAEDDKNYNYNKNTENHYTEIADQHEKEITTLDNFVHHKGDSTTNKEESSNPYMENCYTEIPDKHTSQRETAALEYAVPYDGHKKSDEGNASKGRNENAYAEIEERFSYENVFKKPSPYENYEFGSKFSGF